MAPPRSRKTRETWGTRRPNHSAEQERIAYLEKKIQTKDEVLAERMAEHVALKKTLGELCPGSGFRTRRGTRSWISSGQVSPPRFPEISIGGGAPFETLHEQTLAPEGAPPARRDPIGCHLPFRPSRQAITSSSARTASWTATTGRASISNAGSIEQNL